MQKWEYLFVRAEKYKDVWRIEYENEIEVDDWTKGPNLAEYANQKGKEGWELVDAPYTATEFGVRPRLFFKRPIEE